MEAQWYGGVSPGGIDRLIAPAVKWSGLVPSAPTLYGSVVRAGEMAQRAPRGPVFLDVPLEYMLEDWSPEDDLRRVPPASTTLPVAAELDGLVDEIAAARNPVIVTEFSGREPGAFEALVDFAEAGAIPVIGGRTAFYGNFPTDHDLWQGVETYAHLARTPTWFSWSARGRPGTRRRTARPAAGSSPSATIPTRNGWSTR